MAENITQKTSVQIGLVVAMVGSIATSAYFIGILSNRVAQNERNISEIRSNVIDYPTRNEFNSFKNEVLSAVEGTNRQISSLVDVLKKN
jgi:hypothetical protein